MGDVHHAAEYNNFHPTSASKEQTDNRNAHAIEQEGCTDIYLVGSNQVVVWRPENVLSMRP